MADDEKRALLDRIWRDRMHTEPRALELATDVARSCWPTIWAPSFATRWYLTGLPASWLTLWLESGAGHLVFTHRPSEYRPGTGAWQGEELQGICYVGVSDLCERRTHALMAVGDLLDHLLGSRCNTGEPWLADGSGCTNGLQSLWPRLSRVLDLRYATPRGDEDSTRDYFARLWAMYVWEPEALGVRDPVGYRLLRQTLMSDEWWSSQRGSNGSGEG